jgi:DNA invertase Pin-like site-specific DNA recombinase
MISKAAAKPTALMYIRVSTPSQEVDEQVRMITQYADEQGIEIIRQYGDYQRRHKADQRRSFQAMLSDIETLKPSMILVQRLDRFGTNGPNQLGEFLEKLKKHKVKLITVIDGMNRSKEDLATVLQNMIAAVQSRQEQIDKAERVLFGKRRRAVLGEFVGGKYLLYGFDIVCVGKDGHEKWRMVEDAWDCRIKYIANDNGEYIEVERYGNEIQKDPHGIMPDKEIRHRPAKDTSDRLFYSPSIRQERVNTVIRICEWFVAGWTTHRMAEQLNQEGVKPVYSKKGWYSALIDGLLDNTVIIGRPAWNRTTQANFRRMIGGKIVDANEDNKGIYQQNQEAEWIQPTAEIFEPFIDAELFNSIQTKLQERYESTPKRSPRSDELWLGGLWYDASSGEKMAGNSQGKHFRVNHHEHNHKRLSFKEAEWFISEYLHRVGKRLDTLGEAVESKRVLERLSEAEWMKELHLEYILLEIQSYLETKLKLGVNQIGGVEIILDNDDEGNSVLTTDSNYLEVYCHMVREDIEHNQKAVQAKMDERKRLTLELMAMTDKDEFIIDTYNERIGQLSKEITSATDAPKYMEWWNEVYAEVELLRQQQATVKQAIEQGGYIKKAEAIRSLIDRIECNFVDVPTTDGRYKSGVKAVCQSVTIHSRVAAKAAGGQPIPTMTIQTPSG